MRAGGAHETNRGYLGDLGPMIVVFFFFFFFFLFSLRCDPPTTHPEGLSQRGSRGGGSRGEGSCAQLLHHQIEECPNGVSREKKLFFFLFLLVSLRCDPPTAHLEGLPQRASRGGGSRGEAS